GDDDIIVNGNTVVGTLLGGPTLFYPVAYSSSYRADITSLGLVASGPNTLTVEGMEFTKTRSTSVYINDGVGVFVIYDDGSGTADIQIRDGNDCCYYEFVNPLDRTDPQTYTFAPSTSPRTAKLVLMASSVMANRPTVVRVTIDGTVTKYVDLFNDLDGPEFDTAPIFVNIPAGATTLTAQCFSEKDATSVLTGKPASLTWLVSALALPPAEELPASLGDFVWDDLNEDGIQDESEPGIAGVTVDLFECGQTTPIATTTTSANGYYLFSDLAPGDYFVKFMPIAGYVFTLQDQGSDDALDSDANPTTGETVCINLEAGENDMTWDAGMHVILQPMGCRVTGGGVDEFGGWDGTFAKNGRDTGVNRYQFGGQAGANTALPPQPKGEWTHHQQRGPDGIFVFHAGTASAPEGTEIDEIVCNDPDNCNPARTAPAKQIDFWGVGTFKNMRQPSDALKANVIVGKSLHWFEVNIDDLGEPGKGGKQDPPLDICPAEGFGLNGAPGDGDEKCACPDYYRITIYAGPTSASAIIYRVEGYIAGGNLQIHPLTGYDR
ncbi:MAG: SdrD B-like domain-containing protein, partial [Candidatus Latescibacterota bacterium]